MSKKKPISLKDIHPTTLILCVYTSDNKIHDIHAYYEEFLRLIETLGIEYDQTLLWKLRTVDTSHFLTKGKMQELLDFCDTHEIEEIILSKELSPVQERSLSDALGCKIFDRTKLILEIFQDSAHTAEGKTQINIAQLQYLKTRVRGIGKDFAQQAGYKGTRGPGETESESLRRYYETKIRQAKKRLATLEKSKKIQRKKRLESNLPLVALIGYTNSGKSSILNKITKSNILAEDKLFSTLDTTTRSLYLGEKKRVLISDTVGFISELPHNLIEAFKSTLDELKYADLVLHVVDIDNPMWRDHIEIAEDILDELEVDADLLYVFNKKDKVKNIKKLLPYIEIYSPYVLTDTVSKTGTDELLKYIKEYKFSH